MKNSKDLLIQTTGESFFIKDIIKGEFKIEKDDDLIYFGNKAVVNLNYLISYIFVGVKENE